MLADIEARPLIIEPHRDPQDVPPALWDGGNYAI
jgi:hypothetical protein